MGDYIIELIEVLNIRDQMKEEWSRRSRPSRRVCQQHINIKVQHQKTTLGKIISMMLTLKGRFQEYARSWLHGECTRRSHDLTNDNCQQSLHQSSAKETLQIHDNVFLPPDVIHAFASSSAASQQADQKAGDNLPKISIRPNI